MTTATKRRPTIVSAYAYADRCRRVDELLKACAERDKIIAAQRAQIRDLTQQVLRANQRVRRQERRSAPPKAEPTLSSSQQPTE